jgi:hypothetical protein
LRKWRARADVRHWADLILGSFVVVAVESKLPARRILVAANTLLPGLYAWLTTVALPSTQRGAPGIARLFALLALFAVVTGPIIAIGNLRIGRAVGVLLFVALCVITWVVLGPAIGVQRLEPLRASLGAAGWALFALGWGSVREVGTVPEDDPNVIDGPPLPARSRLPRGALIVVGISIAAALPPVYMAWRVTRPDHALLAHATAVLCAIALVGAGARLAIDRGRWRSPGAARARINSAVAPLGALMLMFGLGFVWLLLR